MEEGTYGFDGLGHLKLYGINFLPSTNEVSACEVLNQRLRCSQADQSCWHEFGTRSCFGRPIFDTPRGRCVNREDRHLGILHGGDNISKRVPYLAREAEA